MENSTLITHSRRLTAVLLLLGMAGGSLAQEPDTSQVDQVIAQGVERNEMAQEAQQEINQIAEQTDNLVNEYKRQLKVIDGLKVYNTLLQNQIDDQEAEINDLNTSIDEVAIIERQIVPLMLRMVEGLDRFIAADVPFLLDERNQRVERLRNAMERADVTPAEKFRSVLEAYAIENEYGRTIESYKGTLDLGGQERQVDFLKVGRIGLMYQTLDGQENGVWDQRNRQWVQLDSVEYRNRISRGLQIAREQIAPDLLMVPVDAPEEIQ